MVEFSDCTLTTEEEWWRAYVLLTIISQAYIWEEGESGVPEKLPKIIAVPWAKISEHLGMRPVVTYAAVVLRNWRLRDHAALMNLDNLEAIHTFTGTEDESWFYMISMAVEIAAIPAIKAVTNAYLHITQHDHHERLTECLQVVAKSLEDMKVALNRVREHCNQEVFYVQLRPFESGTDNPETFPNGLVFEGVSPTPKRFGGASAAQSSVFPMIDIFLGAVHTGSDAEFLAETRLHLPPKHRWFLEELEKRGSVREYVKQSGNHELIQAYNDAVIALGAFRSAHVIVVTEYIINQKGKSQNKSLEDKGTGGTELMKFLKKVRDDTTALKIEP